MTNSSSNLSKNDANPDDWTECRPGELCQLGERLRTDHLRAKQASAYRTVAACALVVLVSFGASQWLRPDGKLGGITCKECIAQFDAYHSHLARNAAMDAEQAQQMQEHLAACKVCQPVFDKRFPELLSEAFRASGVLIVQRNVQTVGLAVALL